MIALQKNSAVLIRAVLAKIAAWAFVFLAVAFPAPSQAITNVYAVNVLPREFSVFCQTMPGTEVEIEVYSDAAGLGSLAGQLGIAQNAVRGGSATSTNAFEARNSMRQIQADMESSGMSLFRMTDCTPGSNHFFRLRALTNGVPAGLWPENGSLQPVTTAFANQLMADSRQLIVHVPGAQVSGWVGVIEHDDARYPQAAVVGDVANPSELYFELGNFFGEDGTNLVFSAGETFTITVYGVPMEQSLARDYDVAFSTNAVAAESLSLIADATYVYVQMGSTTVLSNVSQSDVAISIVSAPLSTNLSFDLTLPVQALTNLLVNSVSASVGAARAEYLGGDRWRIVLESAPGKWIHSTSLQRETVARLQFSPVAGVQTVLIPLNPTSLQSLAFPNQRVQGGESRGGELLVIARQPYIQLNGGVSYEMRVSGIPGVQYAVVVSTNLLSGAWVEDSTFTLGTGIFETTVQLPVRPETQLYIRIHEKTAP